MTVISILDKKSYSSATLRKDKRSQDTIDFYFTIEEAAYASAGDVFKGSRAGSYSHSDEP